MSRGRCLCRMMIQNGDLMENDLGYYRELNKEEILERYNGLECKEITDIFDKYIPI